MERGPPTLVASMRCRWAETGRHRQSRPEIRARLPLACCRTPRAACVGAGCSKWMMWRGGRPVPRPTATRSRLRFDSEMR
eukprot:6835754-Prymnesium_polylepis.1